MKRIVSLLAFIFLCTGAFALNQLLELKGITTVNVVVADLPEDLVAAGVTIDGVRTALESALGTAGLTVLLPDLGRSTVPTINLRVSSVKEGRFTAIDLVLSCLDNVSNGRVLGPFSAIIWTRDVLLFLGKVDEDRVVAGEKRLVDLFLSDYREANPR